MAGVLRRANSLIKCRLWVTTLNSQPQPKPKRRLTMLRCKNCGFTGDPIDFKVEVDEIYETEGGISIIYHCPKCDSIDIEDLGEVVTV
jgi:hypothetical protein